MTTIGEQQLTQNLLRVFREDDRATVIDIQNENFPPHMHMTAEEWKHYDHSWLSPQTHLERLVIGDPVVGYVEVQDRNTTSSRKQDECAMELFVARAHRNNGYGGMLYDRAEAFARACGAHQIETWYMEHAPDEPAICFLQKRGFVEIERAYPSHLDLNTFDATLFAGSIKRIEQQGVRLLAYADVPDNHENRFKLYELLMAVRQDFPQRDAVRAEPPSFEQWSKRFDIPEWTPEANILAEVDGQWVGITQLAIKDGGTTANTWTTGVLRDYRGRGIATALKVRVIEVARTRGQQIITTDNHEDNGPMLAINRKLGFIPDPPYVVAVKTLT